MVRVLKTQTVQSIGYILDIAFFTHFSKRKKAGNPHFSKVSGFKLTAGIEPATYALRVRRSTD